jgi:succinoglycan biosynthesis transport protein ExoP
MSENEHPRVSTTSESAPAEDASSRHGPAYYYGRGPAYYYGSGGASYGGGSYGAAYYGGDTEGSGGGEDSMLGSLSIQRVFRVMLQKWPTLLVSVLLGLAFGFAYYKTAPVVYKASSTIEMSVRPKRALNVSAVYDESGGASTDEILNTRLIKLRSREVIDKVAERVRAEFPNLDLSDDEMYLLLYQNVSMDVRRRTKLVDISARHTRPEVAQAIANAYADTAEKYDIEQNRIASENAVSYLRETAEKRRISIEEDEQKALDFRVANKIDVLESQKNTLDSVLLQINGSIASLESQESRYMELLRALNEALDNPGQAVSLPDSVPRAEEINAAQEKLQNLTAERDVLLVTYTPKHPDVIAKDTVLEIAERQYVDAVNRSRDTAGANLDLVRKQIAALRQKKEQNEADIAALEVQIVNAKMRFEALQRDSGVSETIYDGILRRMEEAQLAADQSATTTTLVARANLPRAPISPKASVAFSVGPIVGFLLGFLFVLVIDRLEDRITGTSDIERHMGTKVLALIPHVPRSKREVLGKMSFDRKFSRLAEAFAGLRGLLDSPRYRDLTRSILVVSTQPAEGKTIIASNIAIASAISGKKTLLIDFDMRRPRLGRIFDVRDQNPPSLVHVLHEGDTSRLDSLAIPSGVPNLDLVTSRPSNHISPSDLMGSSIVAEFVKWACDNYERVVIDSPPFGLVSDSVVLGALVGSVILVCRPAHSRGRAMRHAIRHLNEAGSRVLGVVVNDVDFGQSSYFGSYDYQSSGYAYGYRYGRYGRYGRYYSYLSEQKDEAGDSASHGAPPHEAQPVPGDDDEPKPMPATESVLDVDDEE